MMSENMHNLEKRKPVILGESSARKAARSAIYLNGKASELDDKPEIAALFFRCLKRNNGRDVKNDNHSVHQLRFVFQRPFG